MTSEKAISIIKNAFSWYEDNARESEEEDWSRQHEALRMAIKALEQQPNRCDSCTHSEEQDGSNCYECVKGMADNFEAQPKIGYISIDVNKLAKEVAEKALDEITYNGKTIREWAEILVNQQPCENCISREAVIGHICEDKECYKEECKGRTLKRCPDLQWVFDLPSVTPKYTDEEIDKAQAVEQAYVDKMVELAVEETKRPKGKWIEVEVRNVYATLKCSVCGRVIEPFFDFCKYSYEDIKRSYPYCHCGAEMSGGGEDEVSD